ncbi:hypothetical protein [Spiroplasma sp. BIUS-1]|uniref:hypothetical protein n=1 Tax=Spiroplasma sp. BIUS-1 TaxID=216964 RepID=UPI001397D7F2|nr:hypothetical protein [Spiroplasma sp. BIUS-1]QHX36701.1 hypothetical protein SBIUS_v1c04480 [Spiroplasma sp. BIUS-1]
MKVAGFWRRFIANWINNFLIVITFGIYFIFMIINFCRAKPSIGLKAMGIKYSANNQLTLFVYSLLNGLMYILIIPIFMDLVTVCLKKGTFSERWANNFLELNK